MEIENTFGWQALCDIINQIIYYYDVMYAEYPKYMEKWWTKESLPNEHTIEMQRVLNGHKRPSAKFQSSVERMMARDGVFSGLRLFDLQVAFTEALDTIHVSGDDVRGMENLTHICNKFNEISSSKSQELIAIMESKFASLTCRESSSYSPSKMNQIEQGV